MTHVLRKTLLRSEVFTLLMLSIIYVVTEGDVLLCLFKILLESRIRKIIYLLIFFI